MGIFVVLAIGVVMAMASMQAPEPQNLFVLLPDADGTVGVIEVANDAGSQVVDTANAGVRVGDQNSVPTQPRPISEAEIQRQFADVFAAQPIAPVSLNLYFQAGGTELTPQSRATFEELFTILEQRTLPDISVIGHTDTTGSAEVNERLARERAELIAAAMVAAGAPDERMEITSHGEGNLLVETDDDVAEPQNRRVEISIR